MIHNLNIPVNTKFYKKLLFTSDVGFRKETPKRKKLLKNLPIQRKNIIIV